MECSSGSNPSCNRFGNAKQKYFKTLSDSCCKCKSKCFCEATDGKLDGPTTGVAKQGSSVRSLTMDEQIETLILVYEGLLEEIRNDFEIGNDAMKKTMEFEVSKVKTGCEIQISEMKKLLDVHVAEMSEIQCLEMLKLKEEVVKARSSSSMVKFVVLAIIVYVLCCISGGF